MNSLQLSTQDSPIGDNIYTSENNYTAKAFINKETTTCRLGYNDEFLSGPDGAGISLTPLLKKSTWLDFV